MSRVLKVYPNPWGVHPLEAERGQVTRHGISEFGLPARAVGWDKSVAHAMPTEFVGAETIETRVLDDVRPGVITTEGDFDYSWRSPKGIHIKAFLGVPANDPDFCAKFAAADPIEVPATKRYLDALIDGDLLPGDGAAANVARYKCTPADFPKLERVARAACDLEQINTRRARYKLPPLEWKATPAKAPKGAEKADS